MNRGKLNLGGRRSLDKIMQNDFDDFFGADAFPDAEEFWDVVPDYFPQGIPPHIKPPYPRPKKSR